MYTFLSRRESGMRYNQVRAGILFPAPAAWGGEREEAGDTGREGRASTVLEQEQRSLREQRLTSAPTGVWLCREGRQRPLAALLIPALDCDRKGGFQSYSGRWVWSLGGAIHQVGGRDRNIYCRVLRAARSRRRSGCCPPVSPSVLWLLSKLPRRVGGEVRGSTQ